MKRAALIFAALAAVLSCGRAGDHFISDKDYREEVLSAFDARMSSFGGSLRQFYTPGEGVTAEEEEALRFLYAYMPLADLTDYPTAFYLENVRATFRSCEEMPWGKDVPELLERHFVLPLRVNNENLDTSRIAFYRELAPRVKDLPMKDAILEVNHWCHEKASYQPSDGRTLSPMSMYRNALGRCGEESTFCVAALRSVGIPARQVYTPRWAHTDDNHAWVEAWADGEWWFIGACEPEPVLNLGWFNAPASRAMLMHTKVFGRYYGPEETVLLSPNYTEVNLIGNYAETGKSTVKVVWGPGSGHEEGSPVDSARVDFCIYNYAEFYPAVAKYTDNEGSTTLSAGLGDMLAWASKDGLYGYAKVSFGRDELVTITLDAPGPSTLSCHSERCEESRSIMIVPPPEGANIPDVSPELRAGNDRRFAEEDAIRKAYEATFPSKSEAEAFAIENGYDVSAARFIIGARGNWRVIEDFLAGAPDKARAVELLSSLSRKDCQDITPEILSDSYDNAASVLCPRVELEFLSPYKTFFLTELTEDEKTELSDPEKLTVWIREHVRTIDDPKAWRIPMSPVSVWKARVADERSKANFFVALSRTLGTDARKDPVTGKLQYKSGDEWLDVSLDDKATKAEAAPEGTLLLRYAPIPTVDNPGYYKHFTISRIDDGRTRLLGFDEGEVDMGGGMDFIHAFGRGVALDAGHYILTSGNRLADGSVPVTVTEFDIREGETTEVDLRLTTLEDAVSVIGSFNVETRCQPYGGDSPQSVLSLTGRGFYVAGVVEPGKEPSNHALRDIAAEKEKLEAWGGKILLMTRDSAAMDVLQKDIASGKFGTLPSNVVFAVDSGAATEKALVGGMKLSGKDLPIFIIGDSFNKVYFVSEGYTIGLGTTILGILGRL